MRLIDADKIINDLEAMRTQFDAIALDGLIRGIKEQPTIDAEPVRHGRWVDDKCTECEYGVMPWNNTPYCPNCGAKMDGGTEDDNP